MFLIDEGIELTIDRDYCVASFFKDARILTKSKNYNKDSFKINLDGNYFYFEIDELYIKNPEKIDYNLKVKSEMDNFEIPDIIYIDKDNIKDLIICTDENKSKINTLFHHPMIVEIDPYSSDVWWELILKKLDIYDEAGKFTISDFEIIEPKNVYYFIQGNPSIDLSKDRDTYELKNLTEIEILDFDSFWLTLLEGNVEFHILLDIDKDQGYIRVKENSKRSKKLKHF